jgi:adenylate cyclase
VAKTKISFGWRYLLLLPVPILWCVGAHRGWLQFLEERTVDWRFQYRGEIAAPVNVVYVDVDTRTLDEIGNWPWSRTFFARVSDALVNQAHVRAIGFDFVFSEAAIAELVDRKKLAEGDFEFARFLYPNPGPPVVVGASFVGEDFRAAEGKIRHRIFPIVANGLGDLSQVEPPEVSSLPIRGHPWSPHNIGVIDTVNRGTRTVPLWAPTSTVTFYHTAVQLARLYWGMPPGSIKVEGDHLDFVWPDGRVQARVPLRDGQMVDINWFSRWQSPYNPRESFSVVYSYAQMLKSDKLEERETAQKYFAQPDWKDAVVLIGPVDPLLQDLAPTSFDAVPVPKVGVHGNLLKTIVSGRFLWRLPAWTNDVWVLALTLLVTVLAISGGARSILLKVAAVLMAAGYVAAALELFNHYQLVMPMTAPLGAAFTTSFCALIWQVVEEQKQKGRIKGMFGTYVSPEVVERMVNSGRNPQLGGHDEVITPYFSDIQSFSAFSELLPSAKLGDLLNEYLTVCTDLVTANGGTLDKYIGDAVVAMYGAPLPLPDHAYRAALTSQLVHRELAVLREKWKGEGGKWPELVHRMQTRIGLNTGMAMIGNMGSRTRFNYTMMGDNVNLAARMESGAKSWGAYTMCTEATRLECERHGGDRIVFRPLGRIKVKGRSQAVPIFEIVGLKEDITDRTRECLGAFGEGLEKYFNRDFRGAIERFESSATLEPRIPGRDPGVAGNPSLAYIKVAGHFISEPPPEDWDGVYEMKEK